MSAPDQPPRKRATALRYESGEGRAPKVVATGQGFVADRILERALEAGVPVREDPALVEALEKLQLEAEIPEELYSAVAETLVWAYRMDRRAREG
jgi:flagellar biosynthesis protein